VTDDDELRPELVLHLFECGQRQLQTVLIQAPEALVDEDRANIGLAPLHVRERDGQRQ
jgi:hypothetical protein